MKKIIHISNEDREDYAQEKQIQKFLRDTGKRSRAFKFNYINKRGRARSSSIVASIYLDTKLPNSEDTFHTIISELNVKTGEELRADFEHNESRPEPIEEISAQLEGLGIVGELKEWTIKNLKRSMKERTLWLLRKFRSDLKWDEQYRTFRPSWKKSRKKRLMRAL